MKRSLHAVILALLFLASMNGQMDSGASSVVREHTVTGPMPLNSGFEDESHAPWNVASGTISIGTTAHAGMHGLMMTGHDTGALAFQDIEGLMVGRTYEISAWVMSFVEGTNGVMLMAHDTQGNHVEVNRIFPGATWHRVSLNFAPTANGKLRVHLMQAAGSPATTYWDDIGVRVTPFTGSIGNPGIGEAWSILLRTILHWVLILLPCLAICTYAVRKGTRDELLLGLIGLAGLGAVGYVAFWFWFAAPILGRVYGLLLPVAAGAASLWNYRGLDVGGRLALRSLMTPVALTAVVTLLVLSAGFGYGGLDDPLRTAALRFSQPRALPEDNALPYLFAQDLVQGQVPRPMYGDWLSSDRPPLQTGIVLSHFPFVLEPADLDYTVISVAVQSLWIYALWILLAAFGIDRKLACLILATCLSSGFAFLNGFFVWPKLVAAAYVIGLSAILLSERFNAIRRTTAGAALAGSLAAFALLAHGGSAFSLLGLAFVFALGRYCGWRPLIAMAVVTVAVYLPWMLYQRLYDPPGDRLLKWHLAGVPKSDSRSFLQASASAYGGLTMRQWVQNKYANLRVLDRQPEFWSAAGALSSQIAHPGVPGSVAGTVFSLRMQKFFSFCPELDVLVIGLAALLVGVRRGRRSKEWLVAAKLWYFVGVTLFVWCLLMFEPGSTVIHQGSYAMVLLAYVASMAGLWAVSPRLALLIGSLHIGINAVLYAGLMRAQVEGEPLPEGSPLYAVLVLAFASIVAVLWLLKHLSAESKSPSWIWDNTTRI